MNEVNYPGAFGPKNGNEREKQEEGLDEGTGAWGLR